MKTVWIAVLGLFLAACAASGPSLETEEEISAASDIDLCLAYKSRPSDAVRAELVRRDLFSGYEWRMIDNSQINYGIGELAVLCSWGSPDRREVRSRNADGEPEEEVWVYNECPICNEFRVFMLRGGVEHWERDR